MAATQHQQGPRPLPRSESLQKMLDLEKRFKLARLQAQASPTLGSMTSMTSTTSQPVPILARRRNSKESLILQNQQHGSSAPISVHRTGPVSPLSIAIPTPTEPRGKELTGGKMANDGGGNNDIDDDAKSEQSSICQSPSWEGYGQKKKDKKKKQEAEQQKRDRDRLPAKRRTANRLFKTPPTESVGSSYDRARPSHARSASDTGTTRPDETETKTRESAKEKRNGKGGKGNGDSGATHEKAYPPLSSRSHALRHALLPVHTRQKSASSLAAIPAMGDEHTRTPKDHYLYATKNLSDQSVDYSAEPVMRGRQGAEPLPTPVGSYVRQARAQSIERSIKGFMQEAALSDPNLLNAPNRMTFSFMGPPRKTDKEDTRNRPSSSQSKPTSAKTDTSNTSTDDFTLEASPAVPPALELATPSSGILSSIKSRISRRSSISSGSTSNTGKSFKERAMGAMHLQSMVSNPAETPSPLPSRKPSQTSSHRAPGVSSESSVQPESESAPEPESAAVTPATAEKSASQTPTLHKETRRLLPKAARLLGEINQQSMAQGTLSCSRPSEGSSTSSYHEDSSVPPSPASTPDTSRPQSTKGPLTAMEARVGSTETLAVDRDRENGLSEGLGILDGAWSQSTMAPDNDAQSFVTTLTNQKSATSLRSQAGILNLKEAALLAEQDSLGTHPALKDDGSNGSKSLKSMKTPRTPQHMALVKEELIRNTASGHGSPSAVYLQEARRSAPMVSSPLSKVIQAAKAMPRPPIVQLPLPKEKNEKREKKEQKEKKDDVRVGLPTEAEAERLLQLAPKAPLAKMLVECCHCKFFHDMPSRVYECMAQPDAVVTDRDLGVSGAITTMVKCPWCSHNMSTQCCAGYAAVVYLKERLH